MVLVLDNYDSFTFNLVQQLGGLGVDPRVERNDALTVGEVERLRPSHIVVSPGPCTPREAGISIDLFRELSGAIPMLGVCLGHQAFAEAFGGRTIRAETPMHGKTSRIRHHAEGIFEGLPDPFEVARYHSLVTDPAAFPDLLAPVAWSEDGEIQGIRHRHLPSWGIQFHPESFFSEGGTAILENFLRLTVS